MKKYFLLLIVVFSLFLIAHAEKTIIVRDTVKPDIKATFNETVILLKANLTHVQTQQRIELTNRTLDNKTFVFAPKQALNNGFYYFIVEARDRIGNFKDFKENVIILVNETAIRFLSPKLGISSEPKYDIILETSLQANCSWSLFSDTKFEDGIKFPERNSLTHTISDFEPPAAVSVDGPNADSPRIIYVICRDKNGRMVDQELGTGYDESSPIIEAIAADENPVTKLPNPKTTLSVETSDRSVCFISGEGFANKIFSNQDQDDVNTYEFVSRFTINYTANPSANKKYFYSIFCKNRAQLDSLPAPKEIEVKISPFLTVTVNSPKDFIGTAQPFYDIKTNKNATCSARIGLGSVALTKSEGGYRHSKLDTSRTLVEGQRYEVIFTCSAPVADVNITKKSFRVDLSPPTNISVIAAACKADVATFELSALDNQSGIIGYNYSVIYGSKSIVNWTYVKGGSQLKTEKTGLKLNKTASYTVSVLAQNGAGTFSTPAKTASFSYNPNATICLEKIPPILSFRVNDSSFGYKSVKVVCTDADSGCSNSSIRYATSDNKTTCSPVTYGDTKILTISSWFCAEAFDKAGNKGNKTQFITLVAGVASCFNDIKDGTETDANCGGSCPTCPPGKACLANTDCDTNSCNVLTKKCELTSCTDLKQNGFESDVDCGGTSCNRCALEKKCSGNADCVSNYCEPGTSGSRLCKPTLCTDSIKNGFESDIDCGGSACNKCPQGKSCLANTDCASGSCSFGSCIGAGVTVPEEVPSVSRTYSYLLLVLGLLILIAGLLFMYYLKIDAGVSVTFIVIGGISVLIALLDILLFTIPKTALGVILLLVLVGTGYLVYKNQGIIIQKIRKKPSAIQGRQVQGRTPGEVPAIPAKEVRPVTREELEATKTMIEMIKKQRAEREMKREGMFKEFGKGKIAEKSLLSKTKELKPIERITQKPKEIKIQKPKTEFERLSELKSKPTSELEKLKGEGALDKLTKFAKGKYEDVFGKLPKSEKGFEGLSELEKKRLLKKIKRVQDEK